VRAIIGVVVDISSDRSWLRIRAGSSGCGEGSKEVEKGGLARE
jgi:hypothetical protein